MKQRDMNPDAKVPAYEKISYAIGGTGGNFIITIMSAFLLVYYTNVVGVSAGIVATVMGITKIFDGVSDLAMGYLIDHTKSKYGKARPWFIRTIIPTVICTFFMFYVPEGGSQAFKIGYIFVTYNLCMTVCMTANSVANGALNGLMTMRQKDRGINGGLGMLLGVFIGIVVNSTVLQITTAVGNGDPYTQKGWSVMIAIYLIPYAICSIIGFLFTRERVTEAERRGLKIEAEKKDSNISVLGSLKILISNKYWIIFIIAMIMISYMQLSVGMSNVYFAQYVLGDVYLYTPLSNFSSILGLVGVIAGFVMMGKMKKRNILLCATGFLVFGTLMPAVSTELIWLYVSSSLKGFGTGLAACILPGMLQDTLTYSEWKDGHNIVGMGTAAFSFCNKLGGSIGTIMLGWMLELGRFDSSLQIQPDSALSAIKGLYIWVPAVAMIMVLFILTRYDLDSKYSKISDELKERMEAKSEHVRNI